MFGRCAPRAAGTSAHEGRFFTVVGLGFAAVAFTLGDELAVAFTVGFAFIAFMGFGDALAAVFIAFMGFGGTTVPSSPHSSMLLLGSVLSDEGLCS